MRSVNSRRAGEDCRHGKFNYRRREWRLARDLREPTASVKNPIILSAIQNRVPLLPLYAAKTCRFCDSVVRRVRTVHAHLATWITRETLKPRNVRRLSVPLKSNSAWTIVGKRIPEILDAEFSCTSEGRSIFPWDKFVGKYFVRNHIYSIYI